MPNRSQERAARPVYEAVIWPVKAAVWANPVKNGVLHKVTVSRAYRDDQGNWHNTDSLGYEDLLLAGKALDEAHSWICKARREASGADDRQVEGDGQAGSENSGEADREQPADRALRSNRSDRNDRRSGR